MSPSEIISMMLSIIAIIWSGFVFFKNKLYQTAAIQMQIRSDIDNCSSAIAELQQELEIMKLTDMAKSTKAKLDSAITAYINKFEDGCAFYIDDKLDKERFAEAFRLEVASIFKNDLFKPFLEPAEVYPNLKEFYNHRLRSRM